MQGEALVVAHGHLRFRVDRERHGHRFGEAWLELKQVLEAGAELLVQ
jgi:hypothetical protein